MLLFSEQGDKNKKKWQVQKGKPCCQLHRLPASSGSSQNPASQCFLLLYMPPQTPLLLCGAAELWLCPLVVPREAAYHEHHFPPALSTGLSKTLMYIC